MQIAAGVGAGDNEIDAVCKPSVFAGPDGSVQVRDCKDVAQFGMPACVIKQAPPAG